MKLQLITLWILAVSGFCLIAQEEDEKLSDPIDVTDEKAIESAVGKSVMIKGKVRSSDSSPQTLSLIHI